MCPRLPVFHSRCQTAGCPTYRCSCHHRLVRRAEVPRPEAYRDAVRPDAVPRGLRRRRRERAPAGNGRHARDRNHVPKRRRASQIGSSGSAIRRTRVVDRPSEPIRQYGLPSSSAEGKKKKDRTVGKDCLRRAARVRRLRRRRRHHLRVRARCRVAAGAEAGRVVLLLYARAIPAREACRHRSKRALLVVIAATVAAPYLVQPRRGRAARRRCEGRRKRPDVRHLPPSICVYVRWGRGAG